MNFKKLYLKKNEERRLNAGHLWIYSNEIDTQRSPIKLFEPGELVSIFSSRDKKLAIGYINPHALICVRILSHSLEKIDEDFFKKRFRQAASIRERFFTKPFYRLVYGESDYLPGLIIDRYDQVFVAQTNTQGMELQKTAICSALIALFNPTCIVFKNDSSIRHLEGLPNDVTIAYGTLPPSVIVEENKTKFELSILEGQKTGWFYDHRENRSRLAKYVQDKTVLDAFSYLGGWGIQAAKFGACEVLCIDSSLRAIETINQNAKLNDCEQQIKTQREDVFAALKQLSHEHKKFDVIILDPPALIKKRKDLEEGTIAYLRLNELAMQLLTDQGILVSCSCSLHMSQTQLLDIIRRASIKTQKIAQILEVGFQGIDHPIHPAILETAYLKAFFCMIKKI